jgi:hypothetical protein
VKLVTGHAGWGSHSHFSYTSGERVASPEPCLGSETESGDLDAP